MQPTDQVIAFFVNFCNISHAVINWIQIWRTQMRRVSHGSVETLFRWGGKCV